MRHLVNIMKQKLKELLMYSYLSGEFLKLFWNAKKYQKLYPNGSIDILPQFSEFNYSSLDNENVTLFVVYEPKSILMYERYFELLKKLNTKIIVISNGKLNPIFVERFSKDVVMMAERYNIGRDFGAYKEFFIKLFNEKITPRSVIICNDSMFANLRKDDNRFVDFMVMNENSDYVGAAEYFGIPNYHVQSYFVKFSNNVLKGKNFQNFWENFFITDNRRANIHNGEIKLSQSVLKDGFKPKVFLNSDNFISQIVDNNELLKRFLFEFSANHHLDGGIFDWSSHFNQVYLNTVSRVFTKEQKELFTRQLKIDIPKLINKTGIISITPFLIVDEFGFPFLKRDLVYHEIVDWMLIREFSKNFDKDLLEEYIQDQRVRKRPWYFSKLKDRIMFRTGMI